MFIVALQCGNFKIFAGVAATSAGQFAAFRARPLHSARADGPFPRSNPDVSVTPACGRRGAGAAGHALRRVPKSCCERVPGPLNWVIPPLPPAQPSRSPPRRATFPPFLSGHRWLVDRAGRHVAPLGARHPLRPPNHSDDFLQPHASEAARSREHPHHSRGGRRVRKPGDALLDRQGFSSVMVRLAEKAFYPGKPPFPLMHVDTTWKFREMIAFREQLIAQGTRLGADRAHQRGRGRSRASTRSRTAARSTPTS